jgi:hypothetical protein
MPDATQLIGQELRIGPEEVRSQDELGKPVTILDARSAKAYGEARSRIAGDVRVNPDNVCIEPSKKDELIVAYCT